MIPLNSNFPPLSDENAPLHALKLAVVSEIRRISVKVSGVDTLVGDRLAIGWRRYGSHEEQKPQRLRKKIRLSQDKGVL